MGAQVTKSDVPPVKPTARPALLVGLDPVAKRQLRPMRLGFSHPAMLVVAAIVTAGLVAGCVPSFSSATAQQPADPAATSVVPPVGVWEYTDGEPGDLEAAPMALSGGILMLDDGCLVVESTRSGHRSPFLLDARLDVEWDEPTSTLSVDEATITVGEEIWLAGGGMIDVTDQMTNATGARLNLPEECQGADEYFNAWSVSGPTG